MDKLTPSARSRNMARIRSKDTAPEMLVRRLIHGMGYRFRLHRKGLPGRPDLVFGRRRKVIFVHGCFWHAHDDPGCPDRREVKSNKTYWTVKLHGNRERDRRNLAALADQGWSALTLWECELGDGARIECLVREFLDGN